MSVRALQPGITGSAITVVDSKNLATTMKSGEVEVLATPAMVALMEEAAVAALQGLLEEGQTSVGTRLEISHLAATPAGMEVRAEAEVEVVDGRRVVFQVSAFDAVDKIGKGRHERVIVPAARFMQKAASKSG